MPLVSICIPTYNYGAFLSDAVRSALVQTHSDIEVVVVDNCSTDDTQAIVSAFAKEDPRVRYSRNATNVGMARNFNLAMHAATGEYVKILCADDWLEPNAIELSVDAFACYPEAALVTTGRVLEAERSGAHGFACYSRRRRVVNGSAAIRRCLLGTNYIGEPSATLFRRRAAVRGFDESYWHVTDLELWFHLLEQGSLVCIPDALAHIRCHEAQSTHQNIRDRQIVEDKKRLYAAYGSRRDIFIFSRRFVGGIWRLRMAYNAWTAERFSGNAAAACINEFVPAPLFYALLPALRLLHATRGWLRRTEYVARRICRR